MFYAPTVPRIDYVFLDDGDVMNDPAQRQSQWFRLVGEFFVPRLGGTPTAWKDANIRCFPEAARRLFQRAAGAGPEWRYSDSYRLYQLEWLRTMTEVVGVAAPRDDDECLALSVEASAYITRRVYSPYPGAVEAIHQLADGCVLFTASNEQSDELRGYLEGMEVAHLFREFYGPDLINTMKSHDSRRYYDAMFQHAGVDPARALVVDDKADYLVHARTAGAHTVVINASVDAALDMPAIKRLADLPELIDRL